MKNTQICIINYGMGNIHSVYNAIKSLGYDPLVSNRGDDLDKSDIQNQDPENPAYKKYFMHGTSHHLGLNTHDYGLLNLPMESQMVFTVEPGIYIPEEGFGIRLEDDVVIQNSGEPINLSKNIPIEIEEIESLMNK